MKSEQRKLHWQSQLDAVKQKIADNPLFVDVDDPNREQVDCQATTDFRGWSFEIGMYSSKYGQHWIVIATIDPAGRAFTQEDRSLLREVAFYLGANPQNFRIQLHKENPGKVPVVIFWDDLNLESE